MLKAKKNFLTVWSENKVLGESLVRAYGLLGKVYDNKKPETIPKFHKLQQKEFCSKKL